MTAACAAVAISATAAAASVPAGRAVGYHPRAGPAVEVSRGCQGSNAETEQAVDYPYVYVTWIGCGGIGFARSIDGGRGFGHPLRVPGSAARGCSCHPLPRAGWDPAIAVGPDGTVYVSYMINRHGYAHPRIAVSYDHGKTFARLFSAMPPDRYKNNWGDRDFIAVAPDGTVYLTWVYGRHLPTKTGKPIPSNAVIQRSEDGGRRWSRIIPVSPGYPDHADVAAAPLLAGPRGRIDVLMWAGSGIRHSALPLNNDYFTSSADGGATWSAPVAVGARAGTMSLAEWWIDGGIGIDAAGNLYATWDTQGTNPNGSASDLGWLSYSTDHGVRWSAPMRVPPDRRNVPHIMEVTGAGRGTAYLSWLTDSNPAGYALYLRAFSIARGWLSGPAQISAGYGSSAVWPGDTTGLSALSPSDVVASWGSDYPALSGNKAEIYAADVAATLG